MKFEFLFDCTCHALRWRGFIISKTAMKTGSPARIIHERVTLVVNMKTRITARLINSSMLFIIPLDSMSATEFT